MWYDGLLAASFWEIVGYTLLLTHITIASVTIYLHRYSAHRALKLHPAAKHFFRFWLWLTTGMLTKAWTAVHRKHHARVETVEDPHSPQVLGLRKVLLEGAELYRVSARDPEVLEKYGKGTPDDWLERNVYRHDRRGILLMAIINVLLLGPAGLTVWAIQMLWIPFLAAGVINGVGHYTGYRNFECDDAATNISPWGILIGGEELHNNHHTYPSSAKMSVKWWEFDIGWLYIRILSMLRLAKVKRIPPILARDSTNSEIDLETLSTVINNRFQIMAHYACTVVAPLVAAERARASADSTPLLKRARSLLCRSEIMLDHDARETRDRIRASSDVLNLIFEKRVELQNLWENRQATTEELHQALLDWCRRAEESGIEVLQDFALRLRTFSTGPLPAY
ncbi:MAG: acyl-CoA desaturase [Gammaproteobacteria bacterium]|nr:acyl-CoA desaturase [Gammaproteobacteria bacterium]